MSKLKTFTMSFITGAACLLAVTAHANVVRIIVNKPMQITYRIAHQNLGQKVVLGEEQTIKLDKQVEIPVELDNYVVAGVVPTKVGEHVLPNSATQFNQPNQCSMTTSKAKPNGTLEFKLNGSHGNCTAYGGVFG